MGYIAEAANHMLGQLPLSFNGSMLIKLDVMLLYHEAVLQASSFAYLIMNIVASKCQQ